MLPAAQHALVKKTLPMMQLKSYEVAVEMYRAIFKVHPDLRNLFSLEFLAPKSDRSSSAPPGACPFAGHDTLMEPLSMQARILAKTIVDFASKVDNLSAFQGSIDRICSKHVSRDIRPEHYAVVVAAFGAAMKAVFQDDLSADEHAAWTAAVGVLAGIFIEREKCIRDQAQAREGGWVGFRKFTVQRQVQIGTAATQLHVVPQDGKPVCPVGKGQFSCVRMQVEGFGTVHHNTVLRSSAADDAEGPGPPPRCPLQNSAREAAGTTADRAEHDYTTTISLNADSSPPAVAGASNAEAMIAPGRLISDMAVEGCVLELSVPLGTGSYVDMNEENGGRKAHGGGNSLLRSAVANQGAKTSGKGGPPVRNAHPAGKSPLPSPMSPGSMVKKSSRLQGEPSLSPTNVLNVENRPTPAGELSAAAKGPHTAQ